MKSIFTLISVCLSFCIHAQQSAYYQQKVNYKMNIEVDAKKFQYTGKQSVEYTNNSPDTLKVFYYHLYWNAFQPNSMMDQRNNTLGKNADGRTVDANGKSRIATLSPEEQGYQKILSLKQDGVDVQYEVQETILKVTPAHPILPHTTTTFDMEWKAQVPVQIRRSGRNNSEGISLSMTQWYPKVVEYDYDGWSTFDYIGREFHGVFGNFDVTINIDKDYIIGAGGVLQNPLEVKGYDPNAKPVVEKKKTKWHFTAENIHDFAWAADPDYTVESIQVPEGPKVYFVYQKSEQTKYWAEAEQKIPQYYQIMKNHFGAYPYPTYSFIQGGDGGMEYGMCCLILGNAQSTQDLCGLMFHEAAHSWFQQVIATNESMRAWMDEGFTSYAEDLTLAEVFPESVKNYPNPHVNTVLNYTNFAKSGNEEVAGILSDHFKTSRSYNIAAYYKGNLFLIELSYIVGQQTFDKIMKTYFETWKFKHPTDRDFVHIAQKVSGMDLKWFWNYMTYTTRTIDYSIKEVKNNNGKTEITLENLGEFPMPVDVYVATDSQIKVYNIPLNMTRISKPQEFENIPQITLTPWKWTQKEYTFTIDDSLQSIKNIEIDASYRLADINRNNNNYPSQKQ